MPTLIEQDCEKQQRLFVGNIIHAFLECGDEIQADIRKMAAIMNDPECTEDERAMAASTLFEALLPLYTDDGVPGIDLEMDAAAARRRSRDVGAMFDEMDDEEAAFAQRVRDVMKSKQITQTKLAERSGVTQAAISAMLSRNCRPQRGTIIKLAEALDVSPGDLWPGFEPDV